VQFLQKKSKFFILFVLTEKHCFEMLSGSSANPF
jgi:hypothetical protein